MPVLHRRNAFSILVIVILTVILVAFVVLFMLALSRNTYLASEITSKCRIINEYVQKTEMPLSEESIALLTEELNRLKSVYQRFKLALHSPLYGKEAENQLDPLQFKERLIQTQKRLGKEATAHGMALPSSLGFTRYETELSKPEEIPNLLQRLKILEELISAMLSSKIETLHNISFKTAPVPKLQKKKRSKKTFPYTREIPFSLTIGCSHENLVQFLYNMRLSSYVFTVGDLDIIRENKPASHSEGEPVKLRVEMDVKAVIIE